ncbi:MAG: hypothetical protein ACM31C_08710, partial [Acidobacteriota bacterium]
AALVFLVTSWHRKPTFDYTIQGEQLKLHAEPGAGVAGAASKLHWHLDGSTDCAADKDRPPDPPDLTVRVGDVGAKVVLCVDDGISHQMLTVSRTIDLVSAPPSGGAARSGGAGPIEEAAP